MDLTKIDPKASISQYFTFKEALTLPQYNRLAGPQDGVTDQVIANLTHLFKIMDKVREFLGKPITVHVAYRSPEYNKLVKGAKSSAHMCIGDKVAAVDFSVKDMTCDEVRTKLLPKLEELNIRMEDLPKGSNWCHCDSRKPGPGGRFFKP